MPFNRPIVMEPKIARAMVNLAGLRPGSLILDPFLGPAGLAIEAGHLGMNVLGIERDPEIFEGAGSNIDAQGLSDKIVRFLGDSRKMEELRWWDRTEKIDGIVTDPPFGRSAPLMGEDPADLLSDVMAAASGKVPSGSPLVLDTDDRGVFGRLNDFTLEKEYPFRVHKSLTRHIGLLRRK